MNNEDTYESKQVWLERVMASQLSPAAKVYAFGIYKHMFGKKDESWPGAKALRESTGLSDSHFYTYNTALVEAGYLEVTPRGGRSNQYRLSLPTPTGGMYPPPQGVGVPREGVGVTPTGGTNTTSNTTKKITTKKTTPAAPVEPKEEQPQPLDSLTNGEAANSSAPLGSEGTDTGNTLKENALEIEALEWEINYKRTGWDDDETDEFWTDVLATATDWTWQRWNTNPYERINEAMRHVRKQPQHRKEVAR